MNIKYIYEITSNSTLKEQFFLVNIVLYILIKGFKSYIKRILYYLFKLKYLNQNFFYPKLKKHNFFFCDHRVYICKGFKSHIEKITFFHGNIEYIY
jgi:hypothetical protein